RQQLVRHLVLPANVTRGALRSQHETRSLLLVGLIHPQFGRAAHLRLIVIAALSRAMQPDDQRVASSGLKLGIAPDLVVQALFGDAFGELAGDLLRIGALLEARITPFLTQQAVDIVLVLFGETIQRQAKLVEITPAA